MSRLFIGLCFAAALTAANACVGRYDPATGTAVVPCIEDASDATKSYGVVLQATTDGSFVVRSAGEVQVRNPIVTSVRILTTPSPAALVFGVYPNGCWSTYGKLTSVRTGNNLDIRVRAQFDPNAICFQAAVPFVEALSLVFIDPATLTYSVNGVSITPTF